MGWAKWVFQNYKLKSNQTILELGCGNGSMWSAYADNIPEGIRLILSDFSNGMLESAKRNTSNMSYIEYKVIDAQYIPYDNKTCDIIIANHMLYHVADIDKALKEISRVIKPNGIFYSTTIGENNLKEIIEILHNFNHAIDFARESITKMFGLETGKKKLEKYFNKVELLRYEDSLHITDPQPLIDYILSSQGIGNVNDIITDENVFVFSDYIKSLFPKAQLLKCSMWNIIYVLITALNPQFAFSKSPPQF